MKTDVAFWADSWEVPQRFSKAEAPTNGMIAVLPQGQQL
jgi:hypothetical protein